VRIPFKGILQTLQFSNCNIRCTFPQEIRIMDELPALHNTMFAYARQTI